MIKPIYQNKRKVEVIPYHPEWLNLFAIEAKHIQHLLGSRLKKIHHIGSTSIPNMPAKPVIDILLECDNLDDIDFISTQLQTLNYAPVHRHIVPHRSFITTKQLPNIRYHVHILERGDSQIKRHIHFRDFMIHHPEEARVYAELKMELAKKFPDDMGSYVYGKDKLVQKIDAKTKHWSGRQKNFCEMNTGPCAKQWSQEKLTQAMIANFNVHMTYFAQYLNEVELVRIPGFTLVNSGLSDDTFNYVLDADFLPEVAQIGIADITDYFQKRKLPFSWWLSPLDKPNNLGQLLEKNGYYNSENNIAMYFDLDAWDEDWFEIPKLKIIRALDEQRLQDFALVLSNYEESFKEYFSWIAKMLTPEDPIEFYVGYVNNKPVVRGLACYGAQVVGLYWLSTAIDERKKGYATAMQQFRLKRAKELGYHVAVLQASAEGYPLYQKLGYRECGVFKEYKVTS